MPFNMAAAGVGGRIFNLSISAEDLSLSYNIEAEVISKFGIPATRASDRIILSLAAVDLVSSIRTAPAIDGNGLHDSAFLVIDFASGVWLSGRGGNAGNGGRGQWDTEPPGRDISRAGVLGSDGGIALRLGCPTELTGTGDVEKGYGAGGGGGAGATSANDAHGGGGGSGGAPLGNGGSGGVDVNEGNDDGADGAAATNTTRGAPGAAGGVNAGSGGAGGDSGNVAQAGSNGLKNGGAAGTDGNAIDKQGFELTVGAGVTVTGDIV